MKNSKNKKNQKSQSMNMNNNSQSNLEKPNHYMSGTLDSYNAVVREDNRVTINTDGGTITRSNLPSSGLNPDNNDFFEERANPLSSKGSY